MANDTKLKSGFDNARVVVIFGITTFTSALGVSGYIYDQKAIHRSEIMRLENTVQIEIERRADNELLVMTLEGHVKSLELMIKQDRIRQESFMYELSTHVTDNRVLLSDWIAIKKRG